MKFRQHRGSLDESMKTCVDIDATQVAVRKHLAIVRQHAFKGRKGEGRVVTIGQLEVKPYSHDGKQAGSDPRIGWDKVYVVTEDGNAIGFTDGPLDDSPEIILGSDLHKPSVYQKFVDDCREKDIPIPPPHLIQRLEHHWLVLDQPGVPREYMVAQWSPSVLCWYRSNEFATAKGPIYPQGWKWAAHVPMPDII